MARKILVFCLLLLTGTFMAWGETGSTSRAEPADDEASNSQMPSVLRRSTVRPTANVDQVAAAEGDDRAPVPATESFRRVSGSSNTAAAPPAPVESGTLPTVLRRKPKTIASQSEPAESISAPAPEPAEVVEPVRPAPPAAGGALPKPFGAPTTRPSATRDRQPAASAPGVALQGSTPGLRVEANGPRSIRRGKGGQFVVQVVNTGDLSFEDVEVRITLPNSVALSSSEATHGQSRRVEESDELGVIVWTLAKVETRAREQLVLQLVPQHDQPFELGLDWVCRSPRQVTTIDVQQPQLGLSMTGPKEAKFGEALNYLVTVTNPGTGDADNVVVKLAAGDNPAETVTVGTVGAGQQKQIEVQMAANQAGLLKLHAEAVGDGDLRADSASEILVRRAELKALVVGPKSKFAGVPTLYQVRVTNSGNDQADEVTINVQLPPGAKVETATEGARPTSNGLGWKLATLPAGTERLFEVRCELNTTGENRVEARVAGNEGLAAAAQLTTLVEALADLKLLVQEPKGPRQVGDDLVYEITVANRGSKASDEVSIVVQFADGIEPLQVEGAKAEITDGQVVFEPVNRLAAGQQLTLRVKARAERAGGQRYRAEVKCPASDTQLVSEGTTRVFGEDAATVASGPASPSRSGTRR